jgi:hypothetical protein
MERVGRNTPDVIPPDRVTVASGPGSTPMRCGHPAPSIRRPSARRASDAGRTHRESRCIRVLRMSSGPIATPNRRTAMAAAAARRGPAAAVVVPSPTSARAQPPRPSRQGRRPRRRQAPSLGERSAFSPLRLRSSSPMSPMPIAVRPEVPGYPRRPRSPVWSAIDYHLLPNRDRLGDTSSQHVSGDADGENHHDRRASVALRTSRLDQYAVLRGKFKQQGSAFSGPPLDG